MTMPRQVDLARQLEFYFTKRNLCTDTYLQRLRQLNDGCVPISILANFGRIRAMAVSSVSNREKAIVEAISRHSTTLAVYAINTTTGQRQETIQVTDEVLEQESCDDDGANRIVPSASSHGNSPGMTILAVGLALCDEHPPDSVGLAKDGVLDTTDTIILRDVHPTVSEAEIRSLFEAIEQCPPVSRIFADVAQCWFVTFDTSNRTDLMRVMLAVRSMQYPSTGEYVLARLKASVSLPSEQPKRRARRKRRGKKTKKSASASPPTSPIPGDIKSIASLPSLTSDQFPALHYNTFEWDTAPSAGRFHDDDDDDDDDVAREDPKFFDAASTTTTTSSTATHSSVGEKQGYAAVLMKPPAAQAAMSAPPIVPKSAAPSALEWNAGSTD